MVNRVNIGSIISPTFPSPHSILHPNGVGDYAVRRNNLHNLTEHSYTGKQVTFNVATYMELEVIDLGI